MEQGRPELLYHDDEFSTLNHNYKFTVITSLIKEKSQLEVIVLLTSSELHLPLEERAIHEKIPLCVESIIIKGNEEQGYDGRRHKKTVNNVANDPDHYLLGIQNAIDYWETNGELKERINFLLEEIEKRKQK